MDRPPNRQGIPDRKSLFVPQQKKLQLLAKINISFSFLCYLIQPVLPARLISNHPIILFITSLWQPICLGVDIMLISRGRGLISIQGSQFLEVLLGLVLVGDDGLGAGLPASGADDTVLVGVLEGLDDADGLIDVAADLLIVDGDRAHLALAVDHEQSAQGGAVEPVGRVLHQHAVVARDLLRDVCQERDVDLSESALLAGGVLPGEVGEVGVDGDGHYFCADEPEVVGAFAVADDLGGADVGEVEGVEEQHQVLAAEVRQLQRRERVVRQHCQR